MSPRRPSIAELNDVLRTTFLTGRIVFTDGVAGLSDPVKSEVLTAVRTFSDFKLGDDPYAEHDFGAVTVNGAGKVFWKIDCYDRTGTYGSEDPADPEQTLRVLTIMLAEEY